MVESSEEKGRTLVEDMLDGGARGRTYKCERGIYTVRDFTLRGNGSLDIYIRTGPKDEIQFPLLAAHMNDRRVENPVSRLQPAPAGYDSGEFDKAGG